MTNLVVVSKAEVKFELKDSAGPIFKSKRNIPLSSLEVIDKELKRLVKLGVIKKVDYSEWASPTMYVKKEK